MECKDNLITFVYTFDFLLLSPHLILLCPHFHSVIHFLSCHTPFSPSSSITLHPHFFLHLIHFLWPFSPHFIALFSSILSFQYDTLHSSSIYFILPFLSSLYPCFVPFISSLPFHPVQYDSMYSLGRISRDFGFLFRPS